MLLSTGCSRAFYRQQADADAYCLVDPKAQVAGAAPETYRIEVDPRSRMYDPNDPDVEPMPPDDPLAHRYMEVVDRKKGAKLWNKLPRTAFVENPSWQEHLPRNEQGEVLLDMRGAVELALLESPDYQSELEDLYLSALDVSFERFRFDTQFFGGSEIFVTADGRDRFGTGNSSTTLEVSPLRPGNRLQARRLTATGGELVVGAANSLVWQFAGPNNYTSNTLFDFTFLQPLLRDGGRTVVLERLTIAERSLLANVRQMERYRRGFYLNVVTGRDAGEGPSRRGGFFGGSGLEGFAGVGGGGFGNVGNFGNFNGFFGGFGGQQGVGGGFTGGAGAQVAGGYIGLLQSQQQIRNQRSNVTALRDSYEQLQATYDAGRLDRFQVDLARQALYNAQSQLLTADAGYQTTLDNFKLTLGLPPELPVKVADPYLDRFNLLDPDLEAVEERVTATLQRLRTLRDASQAALAEEGAVPTALEEELDRLLAECAALQAAVGPRIDAVAADLATLDAALPNRRAALARLVDREEVQAAEVDARLFDPVELEARLQQRQTDFNALRRELEGLWGRLDALATGGEVSAPALLPPLIETLAELSGRLLELSLVQAGARLEAITFEPVDLSDEEALLIASAYRRDWQNARAALVDTWRLIFFNANALRSDLDIIFSGDIGNLGDNPFRIRDTTGRLRAGIQFDAPLTRLSERNVYRQSLIEYQQARRNYYQFRDRVSQELRTNLRQVRLDEINFELRRAAVLVAISQVDLTQLRLSQPPPVGVQATTSPTTARDLVQSLSDLLNVQNDFLSVWVNYEVQRMALEFNLGVMELDAAGVRRDPGVPLASYIAGAQRLRECLCNATDLYPGVGQVYEATPATQQLQGELIEPLQQPPGLLPGGSESLPLPPPAEGAGLSNPAAGVVQAGFTFPLELPPVEGGG
ncbi:MAG TPA: TolC family protein [Lacipirellulaceae bacterium]|nr:TolC family protein [Lacipirellulaceae bacterium]